MSLEEENAALRAENDALRRELNALREQVEHLTAALHAAQAQIAELEAKKPPQPPAFVKANVPPRPKRPRKKRAPEHNHARRLEPPTQVIVHQIDTCPQCHGRLSSRTLARRRQIIEVPLPPPVQIIEHQVFKGWCSYCRAWQEAPLDVSGQVVGQGRIGVSLASLITHLRLVVRAPIRVIQAWLSSVAGVHLSVGELVDLLRRVAVLAQPALDQLRERARASPAVHADETGWREGGQNGYVWVLATAAGDRYFEYHHSRAGAIINAMLGEDFGGVVESDFYGGYNDTPGGRHQRCWAHLLRDLHGLKQDHAEALEVVVWAKAVKDVYLLAHAWLAEGVERKPAYRELVLLVRALGEQFAQAKGHPCQALAKRLLRHQDELFLFVVDERVAADNNEAERALRPLVIARKISGGTRSEAGSHTRMTLTSLFQTWQAHGLNPLHECLRLLQSPLPQI
jgi:transposase